MSHKLYHTEGVILAGRASGEANRVYEVLTQDLGLIHVVAQGVRLLHSKLRYHLVVGSLVRLTVVRGREWWRLTGAETVLVPRALAVPERQLLHRVLSLVRRLVRGEEAQLELYADLHAGYCYLLEGTLTATHHSAFEMGWVARLLHSLGYWEQPVLPEAAWSAQFIAELGEQSASLLPRINQALKHAHL